MKKYFYCVKLFHKSYKKIYNKNMEVFDGRDWKYKIAFDNDTYKEVMHHSFLYSPKERKILNAQIQFYRKHFTFQQLIKSFRVLDTDEEIKEFKEAVYKRKDNILFCPKELKQYYMNIIKKSYKHHSEFLTEMLNIACNKNGYKNPLLPIYKKIFGGYYGDIKRKLKEYSKRELRPYNIQHISDENEIKKLVKGTLNKIEFDVLSTGIWGEFHENDIRLEYNTDIGSGKVISKQFFNGSKDTYIIQSNENKVSHYQVVYGLYRNVYPGRANLFNNIIPNRGYNFDSGADYVVNGWSTFSAWHIYPCEYTRYMKVFNGKIAYLMLQKNWQYRISEIYIHCLSQMGQDDAINHLIEITQYPGRFESYVMGAIATELLIKKKFATSPMGLLDEYRKRNVADLFALYKPNTNKC